MERVFVYGTLMDAEVRRMVLGHPKEMLKDALAGHQKNGLNIIESSIPQIYVIGGVIEVDDEEMETLDGYEGVAYRLYQRKNVTLESGKEAWVYQKVNPDVEVTAFGHTG